MPSEDRDRLQAVLEALPAGAVLQSPADEVLAVNTKFVRMFDLAGRVDLSPGSPMRAVVPLVRAFFATGPGAPDELQTRGHVHRTAEIPLTDGRVVRREVEPLRHGGASLGVLWVFQDITERKRREHDLERDNRALTELARQRNAFTAAASHELRTPLTSILSFCELLADPAFGALTADQRSFLDAVHRNADRMQRVITDLLLTTRMRAAALELEFGAVDVPGMLQEAVLDRPASAKTPDVFTVLDCAPGPALRGDRHRLQHVLGNLLENAAKFTPPDGRITVTAAPRDAYWEIEVADTGIGIPEKYREEIFTGFVRAPNAEDGGYPGTGLGLAISRTVVQLHGGTLTAGGTEGEGAAFLIRLPVGGPAEGTGGESGNAGDGGGAASGGAAGVPA
ncbi:PAS domain-containing sensor histidine kinase [Streptomyces eurocidicus]|uniref:histidine kinase n=1 Tax=Streptomyces eurocidicus TaxID=66423 RepID=A0A7W8B6X8_STREU|nr:PAS domain-containing sensor histidine kinase [Streptomyces eurocidicus]MBB5117488.1 signal transduction histidine kinase [Streptomyces eurocidicus]MBF6053330.1 sensor histidine kinase [Streptomyces eurocidicus]